MSEPFPSKMRNELRNAITIMPTQNNTGTSNGSHIRDTVQTNRKPSMGSLGPGDLSSDMKLHSTDPNAHRDDNTASLARHRSFASAVEGTHFLFGNSTQTSGRVLSKGLFGQSDPLSFRRVDTRTTQGVFSIPYRHLSDSELFDIAQKIQTNSSSAASGSILDLRKVLDIFARNEVSNDSLITTGILNQLESLQYHPSKEIRKRSGGVVSRFRHQIGAGKPFPGSTFTLKEESQSNEYPKLVENQPTKDLTTSDFSKPKGPSWTSILQYQNQASSSQSSASTKNILRQSKRTPSIQYQISSSQSSGDIPSSFEVLPMTKNPGAPTSKPPVKNFGTANFGTRTTGSHHPNIVAAVPSPKGVDVGLTSTPSKRQPEKVSSTTAFGLTKSPAKSTHFRQKTPNSSKFPQPQDGNAANAKDVWKPMLHFEGRTPPMSTNHNSLVEELHVNNRMIDELSTKIVNLECYKKETSSTLIEAANALENLRERLKIAEATGFKQDAELRANHRRKMDTMIAKKDIEKDSVTQALKLKYEARIEEADQKSRLYKEAQDNIQRLEEKIHNLEQDVVDISLAKTAVERKYQDLSMKTIELEEFEEGYKQIQGRYNELENECNDFAAECKELKEKLQALEEVTENSSGSRGHDTAGLLPSTNASKWIAAGTTAADHLDGLVHQWENKLQLKIQSLEQKRHHIGKADFEIAKLQLPGPTPELAPTQPAEHPDQVEHSTKNIASFMSSDVGLVPLRNENTIPIPERRPKTKTSDHGGSLSVPKRPSSTPASTSLRTWATVVGRGLPPSSRTVLSLNPFSQNSAGQTHGRQSPGQQEEWPVVGRRG